MKPPTWTLASFLALLIGLTSHIASGQDWPGIRDSLYSEILNEQRKIQVVLPGEYKDNPTIVVRGNVASLLGSGNW